MLRALGFGQPESVDRDQEDFDPTSERCWSYVDEHLKYFEEKRNQLLALDAKLELGMCALPLFMWQLGLIGPISSIIADLVLGYAVASSYDRGTMRQNFDKALDEVHAIYRWCAKKQSPAISHDPRFLAMLEAIIPFTQDWETLVPWNFSKAATHEVSDRYLEIFAKSIHHVTNLLPKQDKDPSLLSQLMGKKDDMIELPKLPNVKEHVTSNKWYQLFATVNATVKLNMYGHQFDLKDKQGMTSRKG